jgi:hypothetical protein
MRSIKDFSGLLLLVDKFNNHTWTAYGQAPSAAFVIDTDGTVVLSQPWVEPRGIRDALDTLLQVRDQ